MITALIAIFIIGYLAIAFEHPININKTASALLIGVATWAVYILSVDDTHIVTEQLSHHLAEISEILFFLLGAMTIVELIDAHQGFTIITKLIKTDNKVTLLWIISLLTFFLSAVLDNLTTAIVMVSLLRKLIANKEDRMFYVGIVVIAANAGGAWSPIGDVTTTMLWIKGQVTAVSIMKQLILPSLVCVLVPLIYLSFKLKGTFQRPKQDVTDATNVKGGRTMFFAGVAALLFVPVFKTVTHLPPYMGVLLGLGVLWVLSEIIHKDKEEEEKKPFTAAHALSKIDTSSILFFFGILAAIAALESVHVLTNLAAWMDSTIKNLDVIVMSIGVASAVVDNVPLVAATQGMYDLTTYPADSKLWEFIAYCAGTGGSILIIGSAAGVAVMGMEKIDFIWYLKRISLLALMGYIAGALVYLGMYSLL